MSDLFATSSAILSPCGAYRYRLERQSRGSGTTVVVMVNPSTADAEQDDATIRKLKGFGERHAWGRIVVGNLFAFRATDVRALASASDPVGPKNDHHLRMMMLNADRIILAWGPVTKVPARLRNRWREVWRRMPAAIQPESIGTPAKCGHPRHPLMLAYAEPIVPWSPPIAQKEPS